MRLLTAITTVCALGLLACSSTQESYGHQVPYTRNYIFEDEIKSSAAANAFDLIRTLRPHWFRGRGPKSLVHDTVSFPIAYVDGNRYGDINSLLSLPVTNITEIQYMNAGDATIKLGMDHPAGAILITMFH